MTVAGTWKRLNTEQRVAAVACVLLIISTAGPFSFVEVAVIVTALGVLTLLRKRAEGRVFHLPFGDGSVVMAAGVWSALLIVARLFDRPPGQSVLALVCAALLTAAGIRERSKRPADDLPPPPPPRRPPPASPPLPGEDPTVRIRAGEDLTEAIDPRDRRRPPDLPDRSDAPDPADPPDGGYGV